MHDWTGKFIYVYTAYEIFNSLYLFCLNLSKNNGWKSQLVMNCVIPFGRNIILRDYCLVNAHVEQHCLASLLFWRLIPFKCFHEDRFLLKVPGKLRVKGGVHVMRYMWHPTTHGLFWPWYCGNVELTGLHFCNLAWII